MYHGVKTIKKGIFMTPAEKQVLMDCAETVNDMCKANPGMTIKDAIKEVMKKLCKDQLPDSFPKDKPKPKEPLQFRSEMKPKMIGEY